MTDSTNNKLIIRQYTEQVLNTGNVENISDFISPNYVEVFNNQKYELGIEGAKEHVLGVRKTYPDLTLNIEHQIAEGDWVATSYTMRGTHRGEWMGIKATNKKIVVTGVNIDRVVNGKIVKHGGAANLFNSLLDIGAIKLLDE
ncbi:ester cyclase [Bacteroidota bacterium]